MRPIPIFDSLAFAIAALILVYWYVSADLFNEAAIHIQGSYVELDELFVLAMLAGCAVLPVAARYHVGNLETARRIRALAYSDALTGLANRRRFDEVLGAACRVPRGPNLHALLLLDLNRFKAVNDVHGHAAGDEVLAAVARRLFGSLRESDLVARLGGDEFAILAGDLAGEDAAASIALRVIAALESPVEAANAVHHIGVAIGITMLGGDGLSISEAMRRADVALYRAKGSRRSSFRFFEPHMDACAQERAAIETALRDLIEKDAIEISYRPTVDLRTREVVAFDAVPRWQGAILDHVSAERIAAIAEETGLSHAISERVLRGACLAAVGWAEHVTLAVRLQSSQLIDPALPEQIVRTLQDTGLAAARLEVGITESALLGDPEHARRALAALRAAGIGVVLENFGTGYASLRELLCYRLDKVKIDRGFVAAMDGRPERVDAVRALVGLGRGLGLTITADGVAEARQEVALIDTGCEFAQGSLFSAHLSASEAAALAGAPRRRTSRQRA